MKYRNQFIRMAESASEDHCAWLVDASQYMTRLDANYDSPIEFLFCAGCFFFVWTNQDVDWLNHEDDLSTAALESGGSGVANLDKQVEVNGFRVDFALTLARSHGNLEGPDGVNTAIIGIECDGYEFHHGNPSSAARDKARDRKLAPHFDAFIRFTGSEINADAYSCAKQAFEIAEQKLRQKSGGA